MTTYEYFINLDERGEFFADVRSPMGTTIFEIHGFDIFEDGFMRNNQDLDGLESHLQDLGLLEAEDTICHGN